ncbi:MAG TPA: cupin domain-containing protein [Steroidobacteraceae bacterium]
MKNAKFIALALLMLSSAVLADDKPAQPTRSILERHDQSGVPGKEIVIGTATLPPGATFPYHTHPGDEVGYILKGSVTGKTKGQPDKVLKAGDSFFNPRGAEHSVVAGPEGAEIVSSWIVDKGKPMSTLTP